MGRPTNTETWSAVVARHEDESFSLPAGAIHACEHARDLNKLLRRRADTMGTSA